MDGATIAAVPEGERLRQGEIVGLFGPLHREMVWVSKDGASLRPLYNVPERATEVWRAAIDRGDADTADLEWRLHDHGISVSDVRAQLEVAARVLDDLGVDVQWDDGGLGFVFSHGIGEGDVADQSLGLRNADFGPIRLFDDRNGEAFPLDHVRLQAIAILGGVDMTATMRRVDAEIFAARHRIDIPAAVLDGMTPWQREWAGGGLRMGAFEGRIVAFARDERMMRQCIYDGPDMNGAASAVLGHAALMEDRQTTRGVAAMSM